MKKVIQVVRSSISPNPAVDGNEEHALTSSCNQMPLSACTSCHEDYLLPVVDLMSR